MPSDSRPPVREPLASLAFGAVGVVFCDIGTSPLYALKEVFQDGITVDRAHVLGVLSLIFWSLTLVVACKYTLFILRANNKGEGGIMALMALALNACRDDPRKTAAVVSLGILGASLFFGDIIITPAISVLGALEGLQIVSPALSGDVLPLALLVLGGLFIFQSSITARIGKIFSPVMVLWFGVLALTGLIHLIEHPEVLLAVNPVYAAQFLAEIGWKGFLVMGAIVLVITGAEALYADMGPFGLKPVRLAWFGYVFPALLLNYFGQGALLLDNPAAVQNPFYFMVPVGARFPLLILATLAALIASQAVISGAFSVIRQAIQLGYCPRLNVLHISDGEKSRVYLPTVNWLLMIAVTTLVFNFQSTSALASAYGIAVTGTMIVDTILAFIVIEALWHWQRIKGLAFLALFLAIDFQFLFANSLKIQTGGWVSLGVGALVYIAMTTWIQGRALLHDYMEEKHLLFEELEQEITGHLVTVEGTAIYLARTLKGVPPVLLHNLEHNHALHEQVIVLTIVTKDEPYVDEAHRLKIRMFGKNREFYRVKLYYGFKQNADVRRALELLNREGLVFDPKKVSFFIGSERVSFRMRSPMPPWRRGIFCFLFDNSTSPIDFFKIPVDRVVELGVRVEL